MTSSIYNGPVRRPGFSGINDKQAGSVRAEFISCARGRALETVIDTNYQYESPMNEAKPEATYVVPECNCNRAERRILCRSCGFTFKGRVRTKCVIHKKVIHLMDIDACPNCYATQLKEFGDGIATRSAP